MPKVLTAARVRVPPTNEADYLATLRELCQFAEARGQRIWIFRNAKDPQLFTEFSESQRRFTRYSPVGNRSPDAALAEMSERELVQLFHESQPAWTAPEGAYGAR